MSSKEKEPLFKPEDFEKPGKIFTEKDFDKPLREDSKPPEEPLPPISPAPVPKKSKKWIIALAVIAVVGIGYYSYSGLSKDEVTTIERSEVIETAQTVSEPAPEPSSAPIVESEPASEPAPAPIAESKVAQTESVKATLDVEAQAIKVIRGDYGNIPRRKELLGSTYELIQSRVNQLKEEGFF